MNKKSILLLLIIVMLSISTTLLFYYGFIVIKTEDIDMDIIVGNKIGFNTDTDSIHFGTLYGGSESRRTLLINNKNDFPITVNIGVHGDFMDWVDVEEEFKVVEPLSNTSVNFIARPPKDADFGKYTGYSTIILKRKFV